MDVELQINNSANPLARFVTWAPSPCRIRVTNPSGATTPTVNVTITGVSVAGGGTVVFPSGTTGSAVSRPNLKRNDRGLAVIDLQNLLGVKADGVFGSKTEQAVRAFQASRNIFVDGVVGSRTWEALTASPASAASSNSLTLPVPIDGASVPFFVAGKYGQPSVNNGDVKIEARSGTTLVGSVEVMVRIRKNATTLTPGERNRFLSAFAQLNSQGLGRFADFRNMHTDVTSPQAHGAPGFLPWHRAYLLDLERELQAIDPSVALPYWRFDQAAPNLFKPDFFGASDSLGTVQFSATNPLQFWTTDGVQGINRRPFFKTAAVPEDLRTEAQTLGLGTRYSAFRDMEGNPHGSAHASFGGSISEIDTAAKDPLFFLLHCNVDRLWAKWQRQNRRFDSAQADSFHNSGRNPIGHNLSDTMWPWNGITGGQRPPTAPGGAMAASPCVSAPGPTPSVRDCLDYHGVVNASSHMGFDYDDVSV
jgi:tyrosinase